MKISTSRLNSKAANTACLKCNAQQLIRIKHLTYESLRKYLSRNKIVRHFKADKYKSQHLKADKYDFVIKDTKVVVWFVIFNLMAGHSKKQEKLQVPASFLDKKFYVLFVDGFGLIV